MLEKPLVPAFSKNSRGLVLFKGSVVTGVEAAKPEPDGICVQKDGSDHRPFQKAEKIPKDKYQENEGTVKRTFKIE